MNNSWLNAFFRVPTKLQARLNNLRTASRSNASYTVTAIATYYPYSATVFTPVTPIRKLQPGRQSRHKQIRKRKATAAQSPEDLARSLRRTKAMVRDYIYCNTFELFCTFTFAEDRQDITKSRHKMSIWLRRQQKQYGNFSYLIVPELHKDGAIHFHALIKDYQGPLATASNPKNGKAIFHHGSPVYNFSDYPHGLSTALKIDSDPTSPVKLANYLRKYITKDMPQFGGKKRYWVSRGLRKPRIEYNPSWIDTTTVQPNKQYASPNGTTSLYLTNQIIPERYRFGLFEQQQLPGLEDVGKYDAGGNGNQPKPRKLQPASSHRKAHRTSPHDVSPINSNTLHVGRAPQFSDSRDERPDTKDARP
jgi:hypothetical protein